jgi:hypothetical protein
VCLLLLSPRHVARRGALCFASGAGFCFGHPYAQDRHPENRRQGDCSLPIITGTESEQGGGHSKLRAETGYITFDDGFANTGSAQSTITYIDGEQGILRYRGYPIEQLAEKSNFIETAWLVIHGELPTPEQRTTSRRC